MAIMKFPVELRELIGKYLHFNQFVVIINHPQYKRMQNLKQVLLYFAETGDSRTAKFFFSQNWFRSYRIRRFLSKSPAILKLVAKSDSVELVDMIFKMGAKRTSKAIEMACGEGNLEIVKFLCEKMGIQTSADAMNFAAENNHLEIVQYLHSIEAKCTARAMDWASRNGNLEVVKWLNENRDEKCSFRALQWAKENNRREVCEYLEAYVLNK